MHRRRALAVVAACVAGLLPASLDAAVAAPLTTYTVDTAADELDNGCDAAGGTPGVLQPGDLSLREALCLADTDLVESEIVFDLPAGTVIQLDAALGSLYYGYRPDVLTVRGSVTVQGAGSSRLLELDPSGEGGVDVTLIGLTLRGGRAADIGGGAIVAGAYAGPGRDRLTLSGVTLTDNQVTTTAPNAPGGAVQFIGGDLSLVATTATSNSTAGASGGAIYFEAVDPAEDELSISGGSLSSNVVTSSGPAQVGGGAVAVVGTSTITGVQFFSNQTSGSGITGGAAVLSDGTLTLTGSPVISNATTGGAPDPLAGGAVQVRSGTATVDGNRFTGNTSSAGPEAVLTNALAGATATGRNWFGCNEGPSGPAGSCDTGTGSGLTPHLVLTAASTPSSTVLGGTGTLDGSFRTDSAGQPTTDAQYGVLEGQPAFFAGGSVLQLAAQAPVEDGLASTPWTAVAVGSAGSVSVNNAMVAAPVKVVAPLAVTTAALPAARVGVAYPQTTLTASGGNAGTVTWSATGLPPGLALSSAGVLSGTPTEYGRALVTVTASDTDPAQSADRQLELLVGADVPVGARPTGLAATSDGRLGYVAGTDGDSVSLLDLVVDPGQPPAEQRVALPAGSRPVGIEPVSTGQAYVSLSGLGGVAVLDGTDVGQVLQHESLKTPQGLAFDPARRVLFVANHSGGSITALGASSDGSTLSFLRRKATSGKPTDLVVVGDRLWVSDFGRARVSVYAIGPRAQLTLVAHVPVGTKPAYLAAGADRVYVANVGSGTVSVLDAAGTPAVSRTVPVGPRSYGVAVDPATDRLYASSIGSRLVRVFDDLADPVARPQYGAGLPTGTDPSAVLHTRSDAGRTVLVTNGTASSVTAYPLD